MSDFRFHPWPVTIDITTLLEFCSWLLKFAKEVKFLAIYKELSSSKPILTLIFVHVP